MRIVNPITHKVTHAARKGVSRMFIVLMSTVFYGALVSSHVAAAQPMHNMHGMEHGRSINCITLCTSTTPKNESPTFEDGEEDKQKPDVSFQPDPAQIILALSHRYSEMARAVTDFEPPPGLPAYILFSVFRP